MADTARPRLGVIGLGAMGARIATRLVWEGFNPQVYDVVDIAVRMFTNDVGGMMSGSPKMMAQSCDVIITVLPSADALRDVLYGWEGLAGGFDAGRRRHRHGHVGSVGDRRSGEATGGARHRSDRCAGARHAGRRARGQAHPRHRRRSMPWWNVAGRSSTCWQTRTLHAGPVGIGTGGRGAWRLSARCARSLPPARHCASASDLVWMRNR